MTRYVEIVKYLIVGVATTGVNFIVYYTASRALGVNMMWANCLAWFFAVLFAFIASRYIVFQDKDDKIIMQFTKFVSSRLFSGVIEQGLFVIFLTWSGIGDLKVKVLIAIVTIILNYITSKYIVFKTTKKV